MSKKPSGVRPTKHKGTKMAAFNIKRMMNNYKLKNGHIKAPRI